LSLFLLLSRRRSSPETIKVLPDDPFSKTMTPSQTFEIDAKEDNTIEGNNGTVILLPKGCFKNHANDVVEVR